MGLSVRLWWNFRKLWPCLWLAQSFIPRIENSWTLGRWPWPLEYQTWEGYMEDGGDGERSCQGAIYSNFRESITILLFLQLFSDSKMSCLVRITVASYRDGIPALQTPKRWGRTSPTPSFSLPNRPRFLGSKTSLQTRTISWKCFYQILSKWKNKNKDNAVSVSVPDCQLCFLGQSYPSFWDYSLPGKSPFFLLKYPFFHELIIITAVLLLNQCFFSFSFFTILTRQKKSVCSH